MLKRLSVHGAGLLPAIVQFDAHRTLIRGPSDTGKSHIWDCIWFLLGGKALPELFPESIGYDSLELSFLHDQREYLVRKAMTGGAARVLARMDDIWVPDGTPNLFDEVSQEIGELLVRLSGAKGKKVLHKRSKHGWVTGDDLRHWALLSQPRMISRDATKGKDFGAYKRASSFSLFLSGLDDSAVEPYKSSSLKDQARGRLAGAEAELARLQRSIPANMDKPSAVAALARVDERLNMLDTQHHVRSAFLRELRQKIAEDASALKSATAQLASATAMHERFAMLDLKYLSDLSRLGAADESMTFFQVLEEVSCPLCGTPVEEHIHPGPRVQQAPSKYRAAISAEASKIHELRRGLQPSLEHEHARIALTTVEAKRLIESLREWENEEAMIVRAAETEFDVAPRALAGAHTKFSALIDAFDELHRLEGEIALLKQETQQKRMPLVRNVGGYGDIVGDLARRMLNEWGFASIKSVHVDLVACDLMIDGRRRLSYGAGKRGLFLSAMAIALMQNALKQGHPHLGLVVLDSPLKAYSQKESLDNADRDIPTTTVNDRFYAWLSRFKGPGQIIVLENEAVDSATASDLDAIEFTDDYGSGRQGFYPPKKDSKQ